MNLFTLDNCLKFCLRSCYVTQAGLELLGLSDSLAPAKFLGKACITVVSLYFIEILVTTLRSGVRMHYYAQLLCNGSTGGYPQISYMVPRLERT